MATREIKNAGSKDVQGMNNDDSDQRPRPDTYPSDPNHNVSYNAK